LSPNFYVNSPLRIRRVICICGLVVLHVVPVFGEAFEKDLIAHYRLDKNGNDSAGKSPPFVIARDDPLIMSVPGPLYEPGALLTNGVIYVNGEYEANGIRYNYLSTPPIKELRYESFTVGLDFYPLPQKRKFTALEVKLDLWTRGFYGRLFGNKGYRNDGNILTGGSSYRWIGFNREYNLLNLTLNNQDYVHEFKGVKVMPGRWHKLICSVDLDRRKILTLFDGRLLETISLPADFKLKVVGSPNDASDREFVFQNYSNGSVFFGYAAHLRIFGRALNVAEMDELYREFVRERPLFPSEQRSFVRGLLLTGFLVLVFSAWAWTRARKRRSVQLQGTAH